MLTDDQLLEFAKNYRCSHPGCAPWLDMTEDHFVNVVRSIEQASRRAALEEIAAWIEPQRNDVAAHGFEFAAAIRAIATGDKA